MKATKRKRLMKREAPASGVVVYRHVQIDENTIDRENRTVELSFSSEEPVRQFFGNEILDHGPGSVELDRIARSGPLLVDHNPREQVGVVKRVWIEGRRGRAIVRFSKNSPRAEREWNDVLDGIRSNVSVGYEIKRVRLESVTDGVETFRTSLWEPHEISIVSVPADVSVGVGRNQENEMKLFRSLLSDPNSPGGGGGSIVEPPPQPATRNQTPPTSPTAPVAPAPAPAPAPAAPAQREGVLDVVAIRSEERDRAAQIRDLGDTFGVRAEADAAINSGESVADFHTRTFAILRQRQEGSGTTEPQGGEIVLGSRNQDPESTTVVGMNTRDLRDFSICRGIAQLATGRQVEGVIREASDEIAKRLGRQTQGFFIPGEVLRRSFADQFGMNPTEAAAFGRQVRNTSMRVARDLQAEVGASGGYLVDANMLPMIDLLRNSMMVASMGATQLNGLSGNITIPRQTGGATAQWLAEGATVTTSDQTFGAVNLSPRRLAGVTAYTQQLVTQASSDVEALVRSDLAITLALARDLAAINGSGVAGQPTGIINTTGINSVTFGAAPTWAKVVDFETQVAIDNALMGSMGYLTDAAVRGAWKTTPKESGQAIYLWPDNGAGVNGYRAEASNQVPGNKVIFGNWADLILASWDGIEVIVDIYSRKKEGLIETQLTLHCDNAVRHPVSFTASSDAGNQ